MVGCCFLSVVPPPLCCPPPMSLSAPSSPKTCQQSPGCSAQFSCQMALSGTTGDSMKACPRHHHSWLQHCQQPTCARWQLPRCNDLRRWSSLLTSATRKVPWPYTVGTCHPDQDGVRVLSVVYRHPAIAANFSSAAKVHAVAERPIRCQRSLFLHSCIPTRLCHSHQWLIVDLLLSVPLSTPLPSALSCRPPPASSSSIIAPLH
jgi:hypothetical protein